MPNSGNCMKAMLLRPQTWLMALVAAATLGMAAPQFAKADVVEYKMANRTHRVVSLKFYSRSRSVVWPGRSRVWVLYPRRTYTFRLRCIRGEKIWLRRLAARQGASRTLGRLPRQSELRPLLFQMPQWIHEQGNQILATPFSPAGTAVP